MPGYTGSLERAALSQSVSSMPVHFADFFGLLLANHEVPQSAISTGGIVTRVVTLVVNDGRSCLRTVEILNGDSVIVAMIDCRNARRFVCFVLVRRVLLNADSKVFLAIFFGDF